MAQQWRTAFDDLQQERRELMLNLNTLTPSQLVFQPTPSSWSILQVVDHLVLVERAMIDDARSRLAKPVQVISLRENIMRFVVLGVLNSGIKIKTPAAAGNVIPQGSASLQSVSAQWSTTRDDLENFLEELSRDRHAGLVFRHPISGGLTPSGGLKFIRAHIRHHNAQLEKLIKLGRMLEASVHKSTLS